MTFARARFNIYLTAALSLLLVAGCATDKNKKKTEYAHLKLHLEVERSDASTPSAPVPIYRAQPVYVNVEKEAFLDDNYLESAALVEDPSGYAIQLKFAWQGTALLDGVTTINRNRRVAVLCVFGKQSRWLAAPVIRRPISNGIFIFTPDATREEADQIVNDLNATVKKGKTGDKP